MLQYEIKGGNLPIVICSLSSGEKMITESGGMSWMSSNMKMETSSNGGVGAALGRMLTGETIFQNIYTALNGNGKIAFSSKFPGSIIPLQISAGNEIIVQKSGFLASECGVQLSTHFSKKLGTGLFGGEGFVLQRLSGNGTAFIEIDGSVEIYRLQSGQQIVVDTGHLAAMSASCKIDIQMVPGVKNILFGGEGLFNTVITGPGKVYLQTMPISNFVSVISRFMPSKQ